MSEPNTADRIPRQEIISRSPAGAARDTPLLFVHGAFTGAWCWTDYFLPYFAQHGYHAHTVSLRGHGASPSRDVRSVAGIDDYVPGVVTRAATLRAGTTAKHTRTSWCYGP